MQAYQTHGNPVYSLWIPTSFWQELESGVVLHHSSIWKGGVLCVGLDTSLGLFIYFWQCLDGRWVNNMFPKNVFSSLSHLFRCMHWLMRIWNLQMWTCNHYISHGAVAWKRKKMITVICHPSAPHISKFQKVILISHTPLSKWSISDWRTQHVQVLNTQHIFWGCQTANTNGQKRMPKTWTKGLIDILHGGILAHICSVELLSQ